MFAEVVAYIIIITTKQEFYIVIITLYNITRSRGVGYGSEAAISAACPPTRARQLRHSLYGMYYALLTGSGASGVRLTHSTVG